MSTLPNIITKRRSVVAIGWLALKDTWKAQKGLVIAYFLISIISVAAALLNANAFGKIVNEFATRGVEGARMNFLIQSVVVIMITGLLPDVIMKINTFLSETLGIKARSFFMLSYLRKFTDLDIATVEQPEFQNKRHLVNVGGGMGVVFRVADSFMHYLLYLVELVIVAYFLFLITPLGLLGVFLGAVPVYFIEKAVGRATLELDEVSAEKSRALSARSDQFHHIVRLIQVFTLGVGRALLKKYESIRDETEREKITLKKRKLFPQITSDISLTIGYGIGIFILVMQVVRGNIQVGELTFAYFMFGRFQWRITTAVRDFAMMVRDAGYVGHFYDIMEMKPFISSGKKRLKLKDSSIPRIEFQNVSFSYPGTEREVLTDISFTIEPGEGLAIVGLNGAGKTTLIRLLCRIYQPTSGKILVNGINLQEISQTDWFSMLGILFQDYELYIQESVTHNITLDLHGTDKPNDEVVRAAQMASADVFINEYAQKYRQHIGYEYYGGVEPSKGQKQKIALARVLYRKSPIFILDEPTSAIDALSEDTIFRSLESLRQKHSIVLISHKFSNVRGMDKIMLVEHGKIIELGSHDDLMTLGGKYKELFELQAEGYR